MQNVLTQVRVSVVKLSGHINAANAEGFQQQLLSALSAQPAAAVVVNMCDVESLDSAGLMALVSALTTAQQSNQRFGLCNVPASIRIIFELTQLDRVFEMFESEDAFRVALA